MRRARGLAPGPRPTGGAVTGGDEGTWSSPTEPAWCPMKRGTLPFKICRKWCSGLRNHKRNVTGKFRIAQKDGDGLICTSVRTEKDVSEALWRRRRDRRLKTGGWPFPLTSSLKFSASTARQLFESCSFKQEQNLWNWITGSVRNY